jgi:hypothetical protein
VIIATIVDMAKKLGIHTLAEGVETEEQYEFLKRIGCELIQGYYFYKPIPLEDYHTKRAELCSFETNESPEDRLYFDEIGRINFLDNTPLREHKLEIASDIPIAIVEGINRKYRFIFVNNAFKKAMRTFGAETTDEVLNLLNKKDPGIIRKRYEGLVHSEKTHEVVEFYEEFGDVKIVSRARFLTRTGDKVAYAFIIKVLSR